MIYKTDGEKKNSYEMPFPIVPFWCRIHTFVNVALQKSVPFENTKLLLDFIPKLQKIFLCDELWVY